jgi:hypothetical protein
LAGARSKKNDSLSEPARKKKPSTNYLTLPEGLVAAGVFALALAK